MINDDIQKQQSGDNSTNLQAKSIVINQYSITTDNAKTELLQLFIENMPILRKMALDVANKRVEELNNSFINKIANLEKDIADKIYQRLSQPDMQITIFETQKNYAKYGDKEKLELFVKLLISKGLEKASSLKNLLLDDAISTINKMNQAQIDFLSYLVRKHAIVFDVQNTLDIYDKYLAKILIHSYTLSVLTHSDIDYLAHLGCIVKRPYQIIDYTIIDIIKKQYETIIGSNSNIIQIFSQINSNSKDLLERDVNLPFVELMPLGILIGLKNIEIKTGDSLNWNF